MARYYFDTNDGIEFVEDDVGAEHASLGEAQFQATLALADMLRDFSPPGSPAQYAVTVRDNTGIVLDVRCSCSPRPPRSQYQVAA